jgi:hypothetical protein
MRCVIVPETANAGVKQSYAQILAVHAALLYTGRIVYFSGDQHDPGGDERWRLLDERQHVN